MGKRGTGQDHDFSLACGDDGICRCSEWGVASQQDSTDDDLDYDYDEEDEEKEDWE